MHCGIWGPAGFEDVTAQVKLDQVKLVQPRALIAADVDGDGAADLIVTQPNGDPLLLHNEGGNRNHSLLISMKGVADNKSAIGAKVEVFADGVWQKFEIAGASGYLSQGAQQILAGIGQRGTRRHGADPVAHRCSSGRNRGGHKEYAPSPNWTAGAAPAPLCLPGMERSTNSSPT